jgi:hypothetical protein
MQITNSIAKDFCKQHHLQGAGSTKISIGLFHNNDLISVMTFSRPNISKGRKSDNAWELNRFCSEINSSVVGGANKLFKYFVNNFNPIEIISYSDNRWTTGNVYQILDFDFVHDSPPNYWYIDFKSITRLHRFSLRKNKDDIQNLTEWENRQIQGWDRIWDCGNKLWMWTKK